MATPPAPPRPATAATSAAAAAVREALPLGQADDFARAAQGLIATHPTGRIERNGRAVWNTGDHDFLRDVEHGPDTVNPSLWQQARLNAVHGLFEVTPGVWQARGYDLSNVTFIAGETGWIVIDPLTTTETAAACLALANEHVGARPVVAVIYTHSHGDHFGGILGVVDRAAVEAGDVRIIAPEHFLMEAVSENVIAGPAMMRRALYMYGVMLPKGPEGHVDAGLGKILPLGATNLVPPTEDIAVTGTDFVVDGVRIVFQSTPGTEAPAEMNFHFPELRALCMAENCSHNLHNLYTPRGAQVRDSLAWSAYINEAIELFAADTDVLFASHHWPRWGEADARSFLEQQRDLYRWIHDQTMRLANHGLTAVEIAEQLDLPPELATEFHCRGYYGTVNHNVKAVYQRYLGWFDANPAHLHSLPPVPAAQRYVEYMGGAGAVLERARADFDAGEYRWVAEVVNHVVFADPTNSEARDLQADTLEQLGYQAESGPWRNFYLTGAQELHAGHPDLGRAGMGGYTDALTVAQLFQTMGVRLVPDDLGGVRAFVNWRITDLAGTDQPTDHVLGLSNRTLHHTPGRHDDTAACTVTLDRATFGSVVTGDIELDAALATGAATVDGDDRLLRTILASLDTFPRVWPIIEP